MDKSVAWCIYARVESQCVEDFLRMRCLLAFAVCLGFRV
jgi:hypothetical protein